jgi:uncharacterized protein YfaT (DUF1175 family)
LRRKLFVAIGAVFLAVLLARVFPVGHAPGPRQPFSPLTPEPIKLSDTFQDGTPDFLRLDDEADRQAFRRWFTWLAEAQYFQNPQQRPLEINDCAALIRYAYREALREHAAGWAEAAGVPVVPALDPVRKYRYPHPVLGAGLLRITEGPFQPADLHRPAFAQFADAKTLRRRNTHFLTRDVTRAQPGDLLFFRQESARMPFHSMIYLGESQLRPDGARYILYHTGPDGSNPGEIRRPTVAELLRHPDAEWRPLPNTPGFSGVFRWNILRTDGN